MTYKEFVEISWDGLGNYIKDNNLSYIIAFNSEDMCVYGFEKPPITNYLKSRETKSGLKRFDFDYSHRALMDIARIRGVYFPEGIKNILT